MAGAPIIATGLKMNTSISTRFVDQQHVEHAARAGGKLLEAEEIAGFGALRVCEPAQLRNRSRQIAPLRDVRPDEQWRW